ncbi:head outer capsid protein [Serratia phage X20]|uniref:Head outer capsid protein n=1 Tax=Serratia phage X20 TaxID=2006942 RepID=A0A1Z1LZ88_9CAUD|nr:Hoc-like head decoration [Serratia phage X20]ARW58161.1 head outer capsid protein [Serratia phage X20]
MASVKITPVNPKVTVGDVTTFTATVTDSGTDTVKYDWEVDGVSSGSDSTLEVPGLVAGTTTVRVVVTLTPEEGDPVEIEDTTILTIENKIIDTKNLKYIHPLDHRQSAYLWCGWWVMDEIEKASKEDIDWKNPDDTELKYKVDLKTLAYMLETYPNVEVQESRHGYILNKEAIEAGYIY